jgi:hypothetical protein
MNLYSVNRDIKNARAKFSKNYEIVMGKKAPKSTNTILKYLGRELETAKGNNAGIITKGASISSKLTLVLKAFNECAKQTGLNIKTIDITENNISISGDISSRTNTTKFIEVLKKTGLAIKSSSIIPQPKNKGDNFNLTLEPTS